MGCDSFASVPLGAELHIIHFAPAEEEKHQALSTAQSAYLSQGFNPVPSLSEGFFFFFPCLPAPAMRAPEWLDVAAAAAAAGLYSEFLRDTSSHVTGLICSTRLFCAWGQTCRHSGR